MRQLAMPCVDTEGHRTPVKGVSSPRDNMPEVLPPLSETVGPIIRGDKTLVELFERGEKRRRIANDVAVLVEIEAPVVEDIPSKRYHKERPQSVFLEDIPGAPGKARPQSVYMVVSATSSPVPIHRLNDSTLPDRALRGDDRRRQGNLPVQVIALRGRRATYTCETGDRRIDWKGTESPKRGQEERAMTWRLCAAASSILALTLTACSPGPSAETTVEVDCEEFQASTQDPAIVAREIAVSTGAFVELWLCSNPSTGFEWEEAAMSDASVLKETVHEFVAPDSAMVGAAGQEHWTFEARGSGHCSVSLRYSQPWEGGEKGVWEFKLDVQVR